MKKFFKILLGKKNKFKVFFFGDVGIFFYLIEELVVKVEVLILLVKFES